MKKLNLICALSIAALLTTTINAANMVDNYSFNNGLASPNEWAPADWNVGADPAGDAGIGRIFDDSSNAGTNCLQLFTNVKERWVETITVPGSVIDVGSAGAVYWSFDFKLAASAGGGPDGSAFIVCRAYDSSMTYLAWDYVFTGDTAPVGVWQNSPRRTWNLPAGTRYVDLYAGMGRDAWNEYLGVIRVDNFYVETLPKPATQVSNIDSDPPGSTSITLLWDDGTGDGRLIICGEGAAPSSAPADWTDYTGDSTFGNFTTPLGNGYVVYKSTGSSITIDGLTANTEYHFQAYEYNGDTVPNYNTALATANPKSITTTPEPGMFLGMILFSLSIIRIKR